MAVNNDMKRIQNSTLFQQRVKVIDTQRFQLIQAAIVSWRDPIARYIIDIEI